MKQFLFSLALILGAISVMGQAQVKYFSDKNKSTIEYSMNHPLHSWTGVSSDFTSVILANEAKTEISQVAVSAKISTFDSKNANRDSHTMEVTEALKYPSVTFASTAIAKDGENKLQVSGVLTFHGVNKNITFEAEQKNNGKSLEINGGFTIKMTDYNIERPSLMGIAADDDIKIKFKVIF